MKFLFEKLNKQFVTPIRRKPKLINQRGEIATDTAEISRIIKNL